MFLKLVGCLCIAFLFLEVQSQRAWGSSNGGYNSGYSNSWNSNNGYSTNKKPSFGNNNNAGSWGSSNIGFGGRPTENLSSSSSDKNSNWGFETATNTDKNSEWNQEKPSKGNGGNPGSWQSDSSRRPNEKKLSSIMNLPGSSNWNTNSNNLPSKEVSSWGSNNAKPSGQSSGQNSFPSNEDNSASQSWGSGVSEQSSSQNTRPSEWFSNSFNSNKQKENEIPLDSDDENNSMFSSWDTNNKKKSKPTPNSFRGSNNRETTTQKNNQNSEYSKWEINTNKKPQTSSVSNSWNSNDSSQVGREESPTIPNEKNEKQSSVLDTSILDELDKNDWYFGKESNYPKPPFPGTLDIDVSELWNFNKSKKPNKNSRGNNNSSRESNNSNGNNKNKSNNNNNNKNNNNGSTSNNNRRRNRQIEEGFRIDCECVDVTLCEEEDMIITQEDVKFDFRPLEEFRCEKLTEVCCTNPKLKLSNRFNLNDENKQLRCGERRAEENPLEGLSENVAEPGEFPWILRVVNENFTCSASLIHHKLALTAAHCVTGAQPDELRLKASVWSSKNEPSQSRKVAKIIPHPDYNSRNPRNDIALLILETPFELTDNVNTICLPVTNDKWDSNECVVAGWKPEEIHGQAVDVLEKGAVTFLPQSECQNIMLVTDFWRNYVLHDSFVCGLGKKERKSCMGDEGGPVMCPSKKRPDTYLQIGLVSKGMNCDEFGRPGIFTNVLNFLDWINKNYFELGLFDDIDIRSLTEVQ